MERALVQTVPNGTYGGAMPERVFNGNFDWHSSVHAHWALLSMARVTHDEALERKILQRLTPDTLAAEARRLALQPPDPRKELPYGQSWLLLLLHELGLHSGGPGASPEAAELRRATEDRVLTYLENSPFPEGKKGSKPDGDDPNYFIRTHNSWLFAYWMTRLSQPAAATLERLDRLKARIEARRADIRAQTQNTPHDFLYLPAVLWLTERDWAYGEPPTAFPDLPVVQGNAHQSGAVMVSLWPYAAQSGQGDHASCELFNSTLDRMVSHSEYWRFDPVSVSTFNSVGHWVPQFIWMGILLEQNGV